MTLQWYAVNSNPGCEAKATRGLKEAGFDVFYPVETKWKRSRSKARERVDTPLFTGYIFLGLAPWKSLYEARLVDGVRGFVCGGDRVPAEIPAGMVYDLQARQSAGEFDHTPARRLGMEKGEKARVLLDGPFRDQVGDIMEATDEGRIRILFSEKLNWHAEFDADHLEPVQKAA